MRKTNPILPTGRGPGGRPAWGNRAKRTQFPGGAPAGKMRKTNPIRGYAAWDEAAGAWDAGQTQSRPYFRKYFALDAGTGCFA